MIRIRSIFFLLLVSGSCAAQKTVPVKQTIIKNDTGFAKAVNGWFKAWELVSKKIYGVDSLRPVELVFFDDRYVYSTSAITIEKGERLQPSRLLNQRFDWKKAPCHDSIRLPDKTMVPIQLMSFASEFEGNNKKSFFVMPLPSFWEKAGVKSKEMGLDKLVTGVFVHEFSHSQQMQNFGKKMTAFEKSSHFETEFSDDIIQHLYSKDSAYVNLYTQEVNAFYEAAATKHKDSLVILAKKGLAFMQQRHDRYFTGKDQQLATIDEFFLTMEGLGQYSIYAWLINPLGGKLSAAIAIPGVRRNKKWWSQDEGLALFLVLEKLSSPRKWAGGMFGNETVSVIELIKKEIR